MYYIELTSKQENTTPHIWKEGGEFCFKYAAEFQARQIRKMRMYKSVKVKLQL